PAAPAPVQEPAPVTATEATDHDFPKNDAMRAHVKARLAAGAIVTHVKVGIDPKCAFKGVRAFLVIKNLAKAGNILHTQPSGKELEAGEFDLTFDAWLEGETATDEIERACERVMEIAGADATRLTAPAGTGVPDAPHAPSAPV